jgi:2-polyprenyl-3-methyl-5-hydroxy-6-metoxy-1,4-benzoquinol methylase
VRLFGPKDIKVHLERYLRAHESELRGKVVVDIPAGNGVSSAILREVGAAVEPYDLFPGFFRVSGLECKEADLSQRLPIPDQHADVVL